MSNRIDLLTPVGRLVQGSLYEAQTTDAENKPRVYKTGPNAGQPCVVFYFALAVAKGTEKHWAETDWGRKIWEIGHKGFPGGQANSPTFAWKIKDGDSTIPNKAGRKPCDCEGFPGHWVLNFSSGFAPNIYNADGTQQLLEPNHVNLGDYIQVYAYVSDNESQQQPGIYLNHSLVAFAGYGQRIFQGADPKTVGFGQSPLPAGVSPTPIAQGFNPVPSVTSSIPKPAIIPYPAILESPVPSPMPLPPIPPSTPPVRAMTEKAGTITYEQYIANGWTDALLIQHGMMKP